MKSAKKYGISDSQLLAVIFAAILGGGITTLPRTVAEFAGRDGWLSIGLGGVVIWMVALLVWLLCKRFPTKTLPEFSILILGKPLGLLVSLLYSVYALTIAGASLRVYTELIAKWMMPWTPTWILLAVMVIPAIYAARTGAVSLARAMELVLYLTIAAMLMFLVPMSEFQLANILPVGAEGFGAIVKGVPEASFGFQGFEVLLIFFPFVLQREKVLRVYLLALALITGFYMANAIVIYGTLGIENTLLQVWPLINYLRIGGLPILERTDTIVVFLWSAQVVGLVSVHYFTGTFTVATLTGRSRHDLWAVLLWPWVLFISLVPNRLVQVFKVVTFIGQYGLLFIILLVLLLLAVAVIRGLDEGKEGEETNG